MALITTTLPIAAIHGKLSRKDDIYYAVRGGKQIAVRIAEQVDHPTAKQLQQRQRMSECNLVVNSLLSSPQSHTHYAQEWQQALADGTSHYTRLRDYLFALTYRKLYSEVESRKSKVESRK